MPTATYHLSSEELAAAVALSGQHEKATGLLRTIAGEVPGEQLAAMLNTAHHSLMSRGLCSVDGSDQLVDGMTDLVKGVLNPDALIRATKTAPFGEWALNFFRITNGWLRQRNINLWISRYDLPIVNPVIAEEIISFYNSHYDQHMVGRQITLPDGFFEYSPEQRRDESFLREELSRVAKDDDARRASGEIAHAEWRGTFFREGEASSPVVFLIQGPCTLWRVAAEQAENHPEGVRLWLVALSADEFKKVVNTIIT